MFPCIKVQNTWKDDIIGWKVRDDYVKLQHIGSR